ncbi:hypothetical protein [Sphingomonas sp. DT-204]
MSIDQQIEELRMELAACSDKAERAQIAAELEAAEAVRAALEAAEEPG